MKVFLIIVGLLVAIGGYGTWEVSQADPQFWDDVKTRWVEDYNTPDPVDENAKYFSYTLIGFVAFIVIANVVDASGIPAVPTIVIVGGLALILGVAYLFFYGDKTNDGVGDVQVVVVIQPSGADAANDLTYSEVNKENAMANVTNVLAISIFVIVLIIAIAILSIVGTALHERRV